MQGDERECALRAATVVAGSRICQIARAAAVPEGGSSGIEPWQLSMYLMQQEERRHEQREQPGQEPSAGSGVRQHVVKGTVAY